VAELAGTRGRTVGTDCDLGLIVILAVALRDQLPHRRASGFAVVLLAMLGVALILAEFQVEVPMLSGGTPATWNGWVHGFASC
jgi:hypothetical protein